MSKIVDRVRKLLELSRVNSSAEESASAAAMATDLMFRHSIRACDLDVEKEEEKVEDTIDATIHAKTGNRSAWKSALANTLAKAFGCRCYTSTTGGFKVQVFGLESATQTVAYMFQYLVTDIGRLADTEYAAHGREMRLNAKTWKNSFRLGAVATIRGRLQEQIQAQEAQIAALREAGRATNTCTGLAVYDGNVKRVESGYQDLRKKLNLYTVGGGRVRFSKSAYGRGQDAGSGLSLGGGKALKASATRIQG